MQWAKYSTACVLSVILSACGGGSSGKAEPPNNHTGSSSSNLSSSLSNSSADNSSSSDSGSSETVAIGILTDSAVAGVVYSTSPSGKSGITDINGEYHYLDGDKVTFTIAGLELPPVTALGRVTPQTIAEEIFSDNVRNAALNLAILFQSLDDDDDPSNGITVPTGESAPVLSSLPVSALEQAPSAFVVELEIQDGIERVTPPADAARHFYLNELAGNWRWANSTEDTQERFVLIDASGHFIHAEYSAAGDSYLYTGYIDFDEDGVMTTRSNGRNLKTEALPGAISNETNLRGFNLTLSLSGDRLIFTDIRNDGPAPVDYPHERFHNVKGLPTGVWAELGVSYNEIEGTQRNEDGTLNFGDEVVGLFSIFTETRMIHIVLDRAPEGTNCEHNGIFAVDYTHSFNDDGLTITLGETIANGVWVDPESCDKSLLESGEEWLANFVSQLNDTLWTINDEGLSMARNLSAVEYTGDFSQVVVAEDLVGSWRLLSHVESDTVLPIFNFLPNDKYIAGIIHTDDSDCGHGLEYGSYSQGERTLTFSQVTLDTLPNKSCGPVGDDYEDPSVFSLSALQGNKLVLHADNGWNELIFERVQNNGLRGSWIISASEYGEKDGAVLSLLDDGYYMVSQYSSDDESPDATTGVEYGRYALDANDTLTVTEVIHDGNGNSGLDGLHPNGSLGLLLEGTKLLLDGDECIAFSRIEDFAGVTAIENCGQ